MSICFNWLLFFPSARWHGIYRPTWGPSVQGDDCKFVFISMVSYHRLSQRSHTAIFVNGCPVETTYYRKWERRRTIANIQRRFTFGSIKGSSPAQVAIDEVAIWYTALLADEIWQIYVNSTLKWLAQSKRHNKYNCFSKTVSAVIWHMIKTLQIDVHCICNIEALKRYDHII